MWGSEDNWRSDTSSWSAHSCTYFCPALILYPQKTALHTHSAFKLLLEGKEALKGLNHRADGTRARTGQLGRDQKAKSERMWRWKDSLGRVGHRKYVNVFEKSKESGEDHHQSAASPAFLNESSSFRLAAFSLLSFIDNSKYFPGRQLSVMIWTAASVISASARWGRIRRMETILATSLFAPSLSIPSGCLSLCLFRSKSSISPPLLLLAIPHTELFSFFFCLFSSTA